ncbi:septum formation protein Maf, partial [bacterium]|nr:septum formation protein Maf [bacterium]
LTLASASPRRRALLEEMGYTFDVVPPEVEEDVAAELPPAEQAVLLARRKAEAVASRLEAEEGIVLGADTLVACDGRVMGKAADEAEARKFLRLLTSHRHAVITGLCAVDLGTGQVHTLHDTTWVEMRPLADDELDAYIASTGWRDKAGAYALQEGGDPYVERLDGSFTNVVGLPTERVGELVPHSFREYLGRLHRGTVARHRELILTVDDLDRSDALVSRFSRPEAPLEVEIGPGKDDFVIHAARRAPETNFVAIERIRERVDKLCGKIKRAGVANVRVYFGDARDALHRMLHPGQVDAITIHFPDPWPKRRHAKHRLVQPETARRVVECLKPGGRLNVVTDVRPYAEQILEAFEALPDVVNRSGAGQWLTELPGYHVSVFERKRRAAGCTIHFMRFAKKAEPAAKPGEPT